MANAAFGIVADMNAELFVFDASVQDSVGIDASHGECEVSAITYT